MRAWRDEGVQGDPHRDGLIIALLISCPMRLKKLTGLMVGQHLVFDGHDYQMKLPAAETKTGRPYVAAVPHTTPAVPREPERRQLRPAH